MDFEERQSQQPAEAQTSAVEQVGPQQKEDAGFHPEQTGVEEFSDLSAAYEQTLRNFEEGEVVQGRVVSITEDRVLVDINYKSEGTIPIAEFGSAESVKVGDVFDIFIEEPEGEDGMPILSKIKADKIKNWTKIQRLYENNEVVEGKVIRRVKGGLKVDVGLDAFLPASQITWRPTGDLDRYIGQTLRFKIIKLTKRRRNVVLSRRKLMEEERATQKQKLLVSLQPGMRITGVVRNITDFGAFVDVGGIDGLLHVTDMSWGRVKHPSHVVNVGDEMEVVVLSYDKEREKISLGLKQKTPNPWTSVADKYAVSSVHKGKVVSMTDYGAFVQLEEGVEGMVHVSEMSWTRRVRHPSEILEVGQDLNVQILSVDTDAEKISLGIKQTQTNPWEQIQEKYPIGSVLEGEVRNLTDYGAFIQIEDDIDGLLHVSDMSWTRKINHPSEMLKKGDKVKVQILSIDVPREKISLGMKQLESDPWVEIPQKLQKGDHVEAEISKLVSFGAFARLCNGIEGLIHVSELSRQRIQKPEDAVKVGDKMMVKIIRIDDKERKIGLSIKQYLIDLENEEKAKYVDQEAGGTISVGEIVGEAEPPAQEAQELGIDVTTEIAPEVSAAGEEKVTDEVTQ